MDRLTKIDVHVAAWGGIATAATFALGGVELLLSALIGAALASGNWFVFRTLVVRMAGASHKLGFGVLLGVKTLALLGGLALLLTLLPVHPVALLAGMSGLFLGIVSSTLLGALKTADSPVERKT